MHRAAELARRGGGASGAASRSRRRSGSGVPTGARQAAAAGIESVGLMKQPGGLSVSRESGADVRLDIQGETKFPV